MGLSWEDASSTIRASLGRFTSQADIDIAVQRIEVEYSTLTSSS